MTRNVYLFLVLMLCSLKVWSAEPENCGASLHGQIARVWHGRTLNAKAETYERYLKEGVKKFGKITGNQGYLVLREPGTTETEFMVISYWDSRDSIKNYAGEDITKTRFLPKDLEYLIQPEARVHNYDITEVQCAEKR